MIHKMAHCLIMIAAVFLAVQTAHAFDVGETIKAVGKSGIVYEGRIASVALSKCMLLVDSDGTHFRMPVSGIKSIHNIEGELIKAANGTLLKVVKVITTEGKTIIAGVNVSATVAVEYGNGIVTNLMIPDMHRFSSIETSDTTAVSLK